MNNQRGFTIQDLLITIAVLAILSSIVITNYGKFKNKAIDAEARSTMSALFTAESAYFTEYNAFSNNFFVIGLLIDGALAFDCGFGHTAEVKSLADTTNYSGFAETLNQLCPQTGGCFVDPGRHGPGSSNPTGLVNNTANPPQYVFRCHRHNPENTREHIFRLDNRKNISLEQDGF